MGAEFQAGADLGRSSAPPPRPISRAQRLTSPNAAVGGNSECKIASGVHTETGRGTEEFPATGCSCPALKEAEPNPPSPVSAETTLWKEAKGRPGSFLPEPGDPGMGHVHTRHP